MNLSEIAVIIEYRLNKVIAEAKEEFEDKDVSRCKTFGSLIITPPGAKGGSFKVEIVPMILNDKWGEE